MYNVALHRFTVFTAWCTLALLIAGGLVTSTGSGLAVPDWPLSYGKVMPPMIGGILYEHGHRMIASFVGFLTVLLTVWVWRKETRRWMRLLAAVALASVIIQGLLGGLTVKMMLPPEVSAAHAALAQTFFCIVCAMALFTSRWWVEREGQSVGGGETHLRIVLIAIGVIFVQLILGAVMRHTESGLAVPDFPLAYGQLLPSLTPESMARYNEQLIRSNIRLFADGPITSGQILVHMLHRFWTIAVTCAVFVAAIRLWSLRHLSPRLALLAISMISILVIQVSLGAWTVLSRRGIEVATAHQSIGAILLMTCVISALHVRRIFGGDESIGMETIAESGIRG